MPACQSWRAGQVSRFCTAMRFWVRVPVLSTASTVALPRLSTAEGVRASTPIRAKRRAPRAKNRANTTGISLGNTARAKARAANRARGQSPLRPPCNTAKPAHNPRAQIVKRLESRRVWRCSRVSGGSTVARLLPSRPNSVAPCTPVTSAQPRPLATNEPARMGSPGCWRATGRDSPVSSDSSSHRPTDSLRLASAAIRSPSSRRRASPTRTCSAGTSRTTPSRRTWARGADRRANSARARWLRFCCRASRPAITPTKISSISASTGSPIKP